MLQRKSLQRTRSYWLTTKYCVVLQAELKEKLGKMYDVRDSSAVFVFGFRTQVCFPSYILTETHVRSGRVALPDSSCK